MFASRAIAVYAALLWLTFHVVVIALEEPHLQDQFGAAYDEYCRRVPRWFALARRRVPDGALPPSFD